MEKIVVFGPIVAFFAIFLFLVVGFIVLVIRLVTKSKNEQWSGVVVDKVHKTKKDDETDRIIDYYHLVVKTDQGAERHIGLSRQLWEGYQVGDRLNKPKGSLFPDKIA